MHEVGCLSAHTSSQLHVQLNYVFFPDTLSMAKPMLYTSVSGKYTRIRVASVCVAWRNIMESASIAFVVYSVTN